MNFEINGQLSIPLAVLVSNGTITRKQANTIWSLLAEKPLPQSLDEIIDLMQEAMGNLYKEKNEKI